MLFRSTAAALTDTASKNRDSRLAGDDNLLSRIFADNNSSAPSTNDGTRALPSTLLPYSDLISAGLFQWVPANADEVKSSGQISSAPLYTLQVLQNNAWISTGYVTSELDSFI